MSTSRIYLIPNTLGESEIKNVIPEYNKNILLNLRIFAVENEKTTRKFIKQIAPEIPQSELELHVLDKNTNFSEIGFFKEYFKKNISIGIISEAGLPAVADPGNLLVSLAHLNGIQVIPLVGPSSIMLALMASGFNGQQFRFSGYLPIDKSERKKAILRLEKESLTNGSAEIFMETPYRNNVFLADLIQILNPETSLCIACDLTLSSETIISQKVKKWKQTKFDFHKRPAIFILQA